MQLSTDCSGIERSVSGRLSEVKNNRKFKSPALKVIVVAYERVVTYKKKIGILEKWSLRRGGHLG